MLALLLVSGDVSLMMTLYGEHCIAEFISRSCLGHLDEPLKYKLLAVLCNEHFDHMLIDFVNTNIKLCFIICYNLV